MYEAKFLHHLENLKNLEKSGDLEIGLKSGKNQGISILYPKSRKVKQFKKISWWSPNKCENIPWQVI